MIIKYKAGIVLCAVLAALTILLTFITDDSDVILTRIWYAAFIVYMLHGVYRGWSHIKATRILPIDRLSEEQSYFAPPFGFKQMKRQFFNPADMRSRTAGTLFFLFCSIAYVAFKGTTTGVYVFLFLLLGAVVAKGFLLCSYWKLSGAMTGNDIYTKVDANGISWVHPITQTNDDEDVSWQEKNSYVYFKHLSWEMICEVFVFRNYVKVCGESDCLFIFFNTEEERSKCLSLIGSYFNRCRHGNESELGTIHGWVTLDEIIAELRKWQRPAISLELCDSDGRVPRTGESKLGGNPDTAEGFEWPMSTENGSPMSFLLQINCRDLVASDKEHLFPTTGMFYLFYDFTENDAAFIYSDNPPEHLRETCPSVPDTPKQPECALNVRSSFSTLSYPDFFTVCPKWQRIRIWILSIGHTKHWKIIGREKDKCQAMQIKHI